MGPNFVAGKAPFINKLYNVWPRNIEKVCCLLRGELGFLGHYADRFPCRFDGENFLQGFGDLSRNCDYLLGSMHEYIHWCR